MNRALRPTTEEERAEQIRQDKILIADMHQEPDWILTVDMHQEPDRLPGEAPPGTGLALAILFTIVGIVAFAIFVAMVWILLLTLFLFPEDYGKVAAGWVVAGVIW